MISLIVPCYNEQESLPIFYEEVTKVVSGMGEDYELVLVNDGSKDKTLEVMRELAGKDSHVKYHSFSRNFGKEAAMYAGFCNAKGDYVAVMDADIVDGARDFRLMKREMVDAIVEMGSITDSLKVYLDGLVSKPIGCHMRT